jgi:hypothetical protein
MPLNFYYSFGGLFWNAVCPILLRFSASLYYRVEIRQVALSSLRSAFVVSLQHHFQLCDVYIGQAGLSFKHSLFCHFIDKAQMQKVPEHQTAENSSLFAVQLMHLANGSYLFINEDHCPWIGTCVGHHNRRYFLNYLTYLNVGLCQIYFFSKFK